MKKILALIISAVMLMSLLAACGEEATTQETTEQNQPEETTAAPEDTQVNEPENQETVYLLASAERTPLACGGDRRMNTMDYDANGNLITRTSEEYDYTYSYDNENRMTGWKRLRGDGSVHENRIYQYGDNGKVSSWSYQMGEYMFAFENTYDQQENLIKVVCTRNGEYYSEETYTYDASGRVTEYKGSDHLQYTYEDNKVTVAIVMNNGKQYTDSIREYDESGNLIYEETYDEGELYTKDAYTYDADGKLVSSTNWSSYNAGEHRMEYTYDENGCLVEVNVKEGLGILYRLTYTYVRWQGDAQRAEQLRSTPIDEFWQ